MTGEKHPPNTFCSLLKSMSAVTGLAKRNGRAGTCSEKWTEGRRRE